MSGLSGETQRGLEYLKGIFESGKILRVGELEVLRGDRDYFRVPIIGFSKRWDLCLTRENLDDLPGTSEHRDAAMALAEVLRSRLRNSDPHLYLNAEGGPVRIFPVWPYSMLMGEVDHGVVVQTEDLQRKRKDKWFVISRSAPYEYWSNPYRRHQDIVNTVRRAFDSGQMEPVIDASGDAKAPKPISADAFVQAKVWALGHLAGATPKSAVWITDPWDADYFSIPKEEMGRRAAVLEAQGKIELLDDENDFARVGQAMLAQDGPDRRDSPARADEPRAALHVHVPSAGQRAAGLSQHVASIEGLSDAMTVRPLKSFFPTADDLLQQDLPTLGKVLLAHLNSYRSQNTVYQQAGLNRGYFRAMLENRSIGLGPLPKEPEYQARQPEVTKRMMEAWNWLERQGLLIHNDEQVVADWFIISSEGEKYLDQDKPLTPPLSSPAAASKYSTGAPRAFLSYSWDSPAHQEWVKAFAARLQGESGIEIIFDQWHLQPGDDKLHFMERGVSEADFVVVVCTPKYAERANQRSGGVGYESMVITAQLAEHMTTNKFVPVLRTGTWTEAVPGYLKSRFGVDLSAEPYDEQEYVRLLRVVHREPVQPPPIGKRPNFSHEMKSGTELLSATIANAQPSPPAQSDLARLFIRTRPGERSGDVRTVKVSAVIENVSAKRKITDYVCTLSVPRACLTHTSSLILGEIRQEGSSNRRVFRVASSDPGRPAIIFQGDTVPLFALDLGVDQLKMTGTYLAGDYEGTLVEKVVVDAVVEGEMLHAERTVADIFENPNQTQRSYFGDPI